MATVFASPELDVEGGDGNGEDFFVVALDDLVGPEDVVLDLGCGHGELTLTRALRGGHMAHGILMLIKGYLNTLVVDYHGFSDDDDEKQIETTYRSWLGTAFV